MILRPVLPDELSVGQPLPWELYTASGVLLAAAGTVIADAAQMRRIADQDLFRRPDEDGEQANPARLLGDLAGQLAALLEPPWAQLTEASVREAARRLIAQYGQDPDACLGIVRLLPLPGTALRHCLHSALAGLAMAETLGFTDRQLESLVAAALTMNIAEMQLHETLAHGPNSVTAEQRQALLDHPRRGTELLQRCGVADADWLAAVRMHHEQLDGSGYPDRLPAEQIAPPARILHVADYYCAKLGSRLYRPPRTPEHAFRDLFGQERQRLDLSLATLLQRRLGPYPPGTLLRLANRETAVVTRLSGPQRTVRRVVSFIDELGHPREHPRERDLELRAYAIQGPAEMQPRWAGLEWERMWGY